MTKSAAHWQTPVFTGKEKCIWVEQITFDQRVSPLALRVGCAIGSHINRYSGMAFVARNTIATRLNIAVKSVDRMVCLLEDCGHLHVTRYPGRHRCNEYRPTVKTKTEQAGKKRAADLTVVQAVPTASRPELEKATTEAANRDTQVLKRRHPCPPNHNSLNTIDNHERSTDNHERNTLKQHDAQLELIRDGFLPGRIESGLLKRLETHYSCGLMVALTIDVRYLTWLNQRYRDGHLTQGDIDRAKHLYWKSRELPRDWQPYAAPRAADA